MQIATRSQDEVGQLAQNFNQFVARLHGIVSRLRDVTVELAAQSRTQAAGAEARSQRVRQQQDEIVMVATAVTEMASATQEIAGNAELPPTPPAMRCSLAVAGQSQVGQSQRSITGLAGRSPTPARPSTSWMATPSRSAAFWPPSAASPSRPTCWP